MFLGHKHEITEAAQLQNMCSGIQVTVMEESGIHFPFKPGGSGSQIKWVWRLNSYMWLLAGTWLGKPVVWSGFCGTSCIFLLGSLCCPLSWLLSGCYRWRWAPGLSISSALGLCWMNLARVNSHSILICSSEQESQFTSSSPGSKSAAWPATWEGKE